MSKTKAESAATAEAMDALGASTENMSRTLSAISVKDPLEKLSVESIQARANAIEGSFSSIELAVKKSSKELDKISEVGGIDKWWNSIKSMWGGDVQSKLNESASEAIITSFKALEKGEAAEAGKAAMQKVFGKSFADIKSLKIALDANPEKLVEFASELKKVGMIAGNTAAKGTELKAAWSESGKAFDTFTNSLKATDALSLFGESLIVDATKLSAALESPTQALNAMNTAANDINVLKLFPSETIPKIAAIGSEIKNLITAQAEAADSTDYLQKRIEELTSKREEAAKNRKAGDSTWEIDNLDKEISALLEGKKYHIAISANIDVEAEKYKSVFRDAVKAQFIEGASIVSNKIRETWAKAGSIITSTIGGLLGDSETGIKMRAAAEQEAVRVQIQGMQTQLTLVDATERATLVAEEGNRIQQQANNLKKQETATGPELLKLQEEAKLLEKQKNSLAYRNQAILNAGTKGSTDKIIEDIRAGKEGAEQAYKDASKREQIEASIAVLKSQSSALSLKQEAELIALSRKRQSEQLSLTIEQSKANLVSVTSQEQIAGSATDALMVARQQLNLSIQRQESEKKIFDLDTEINKQKKYGASDKDVKYLEDNKARVSAMAMQAEAQQKISNIIELNNRRYELTQKNIANQNALYDTQIERINILKEVESARLDSLHQIGAVTDNYYQNSKLQLDISQAQAQADKEILNIQRAQLQAQAEADRIKENLLVQANAQGEDYDYTAYFKAVKDINKAQADGLAISKQQISNIKLQLSGRIDNLKVSNEQVRVEKEHAKALQKAIDITETLSSIFGQIGEDTGKVFQAIQSFANKMEDLKISLPKVEELATSAYPKALLEGKTEEEAINAAAAAQENLNELRRKGREDELAGIAAIASAVKKLFDSGTVAYKLVNLVEKSAQLLKLGSQLSGMAMGASNWFGGPDANYKPSDSSNNTGNILSTLSLAGSQFGQAALSTIGNVLSGGSSLLGTTEAGFSLMGTQGGVASGAGMVAGPALAALAAAAAVKALTSYSISKEGTHLIANVSNKGTSSTAIREDYSQTSSGFLSGGNTKNSDWAKAPIAIQNYFDLATKAANSATRDYAKSLGLNADNIKEFARQLDVDITGMKPEQQVEAINRSISEMQSSLISESFGNIFESVAKPGEDALATMQRLAVGLTSINTVLKQANLSTFTEDIAGANLASVLTEAAGGFENFSNLVSTYAEKYLTVTERTVPKLTAFQEHLANLPKPLLDLGISSSTTAEQLKQLVLGYQVTDAASAANYVDLLKLSEAYNINRDAMLELADSYGIGQTAIQKVIDDAVAASKGNGQAGYDIAGALMDSVKSAMYSQASSRVAAIMFDTVITPVINSIIAGSIATDLLNGSFDAAINSAVELSNTIAGVFNNPEIIAGLDTILGKLGKAIGTVVPSLGTIGGGGNTTISTGGGGGGGSSGNTGDTRSLESAYTAIASGFSMMGQETTWQQAQFLHRSDYDALKASLAPGSEFARIAAGPINDTMNSLFDYIESTTAAGNSKVDKLKSNILDLKKVQGQLMIAENKNLEGNILLKEVQAAQELEELSKVDASNKAMFLANKQREKEMEKLKERLGLQNELNGLTDTSVQALARQRDALDESNRALFDQIQALKGQKALLQAQIGSTELFSPIETLGFKIRELAQQAVAAGAGGGLDELITSFSTWNSDDIKEMARSILSMPGITDAMRASFLGILNNLHQLNAAEIARVKALQDAVESARQSVAQSYEQFVQAEKTARETITEGYLSAQERVKSAQEAINDALKQNAEELRGFANNIREFLNELATTDLGGRSRASQLSTLQQDYRSTYALAMTGDTTALGAITGKASELLKASQEQSSTGLQYALLAGEIGANLEALATITDGKAGPLAEAVDPMVKLQKELVDATEDMGKWSHAASVSGASTAAVVKDYLAEWRLANADLTQAKALIEQNNINVTLLSSIESFKKLITDYATAAEALAKGTNTTPTIPGVPTSLSEADIKAHMVNLGKWYDWADPAGNIAGITAVHSFAEHWKISSAKLESIMGWAAGYANQQYALAGLPALATGTNYVPQDMVAQIHEGEAIVPKAYNPYANGGGRNTDQQELVREIRLLRQEVSDLKQANNISAAYTKKTSDILTRVTLGGEAMQTQAA